MGKTVESLFTLAVLTLTKSRNHSRHVRPFWMVHHFLLIFLAAIWPLNTVRKEVLCRVTQINDVRCKSFPIIALVSVSAKLASSFFIHFPVLYLLFACILYLVSLQKPVLFKAPEANLCFACEFSLEESSNGCVPGDQQDPEFLIVKEWRQSRRCHQNCFFLTEICFQRTREYYAVGIFKIALSES